MDTAFTTSKQVGWLLSLWMECISQSPSLQESLKGLEPIRFCFSAASNHKMLTQQQEKHIDPIPKIDQNGREILMGSQEQKAESSWWGFISNQSTFNTSAGDTARHKGGPSPWMCLGTRGWPGPSSVGKATQKSHWQVLLWASGANILWIETFSMY